MSKIKLGTLVKLMCPETYVDVWDTKSEAICAMFVDDLAKSCARSKIRNDLQVESISAFRGGGIRIFVSEPCGKK